MGATASQLLLYRGGYGFRAPLRGPGRTEEGEFRSALSAKLHWAGSSEADVRLRRRLDENGTASRHQHDGLARIGDALVEPALRVPERPSERCRRHDALADLVADQKDRAGGFPERCAKGGGRALGVALRQDEVRQPEGQA